MTWVLIGILAVLTGQLWVSFHTLYGYDIEEVEEDPAWECKVCQTRVWSTSIEGVLEGIRIHQEMGLCPEAT